MGDERRRCSPHQAAVRWRGKPASEPYPAMQGLPREGGRCAEARRYALMTGLRKMLMKLEERKEDAGRKTASA